MNTPKSMITPTMSDDHIQHIISKLEVGLNVYVYSDRGITHEKNEDSYACSYDKRFFAVADGVGGGSRGDVASKALVDYLKEQTLEIHQDNQSIPDDTIVEMVKNSDKVVKDTIKRECGEGKRGASTLVSAWLTSNADGSYKVKHTCVGDARIYLLTKKEGEYLDARRITIDQTYKNMNMMDRLPSNGSEDDPVRMIGVGAVGEPPVEEETLKVNQGLLFCTDGLHKFMTDKEIMQVCVDYLTKSDFNTEEVCKELVRQAKNNRSHDDVTALLVWLHPDEKEYFNSNDISKDFHQEETDLNSSITHEGKSTDPSFKHVIFAGVGLFTILFTLLGMTAWMIGKNNNHSERVTTQAYAERNIQESLKRNTDNKSQSDNPQLLQSQDNSKENDTKSQTEVIFSPNPTEIANNKVSIKQHNEMSYISNLEGKKISNEYHQIKATERVCSAQVKLDSQ